MILAFTFVTSFFREDRSQRKGQTEDSTVSLVVCGE